MNEIFYAVWASNGAPPTKTYSEFQHARDEAIRLARKEKGKKFFVLSAMASYATEENPIPVSETILTNKKESE